jgi:von Willebrand factor type A domain
MDPPAQYEESSIIDTAEDTGLVGEPPPPAGTTATGSTTHDPARTGGGDAPPPPSGITQGTKPAGISDVSVGNNTVVDIPFAPDVVHISPGQLRSEEQIKEVQKLWKRRIINCSVAGVVVALVLGVSLGVFCGLGRCSASKSNQPLATTPASSSSPKQPFDEAKFASLVKKVEADAKELARQVEELYKKRCDVGHLSTCVESNYDHCLSSLPDVACLSDQAFRTEDCGSHETCSALYSYSASSVTLPLDKIDTVDGNPTDPLVVETICFTKDLDDYFKTKQAEDAEFWQEFGGQPSARFFGSTTGALRVYPARYFSECGSFDPRIRPWYAAAGSGPKNIIMVLDTSGSMATNNRIGLMKEAAHRVINTAGIADRIALVFFNDTIRAITDKGALFDGTDASKLILNEAVESVQARGGTNIMGAFEKAFDILDYSTAVELVVECNTAILFLTDDGKLDSTPHDEVIAMVNTRLLASRQKLSNRPIYLFTYSIENPEVDKLPAKLACSLPDSGIWTRIDSTENIVDSLSNFYKFFALGLGNDVNEDFVAWVEPYSKQLISLLNDVSYIQFLTNFFQLSRMDPWQCDRDNGFGSGL